MHPELSSLLALTVRANRLAREYYGLSNSCVHTSAALRDVLLAHDIEADVLRVQAMVFPADRMLGWACILGGDGDGTRRPKSNGWHGHLVTIAAGRFLLDATLDQVNDGQPQLKALPFAAEVSPAFLRGEERHHDITGPAGALVRYTAFPGRGGYKHLPSFRKWQRRDLIELLLEDTD
jgi:hypothetical protein